MNDTNARPNTVHRANFNRIFESIQPKEMLKTWPNGMQ